MLVGLPTENVLLFRETPVLYVLSKEGRQDAWLKAPGRRANNLATPRPNYLVYVTCRSG
jgi:hypothetical protein